MPRSQRSQILERLCPHRGVGLENTLEAIQAGIQISPFLVEFDIQWQNNDLYLGHPPAIGNDTLGQALELFRDTSNLPKVDIKLVMQTSTTALQALIDQLSIWSPQKALINIGGSLSADQYFQAETTLVANTRENISLNIDLERYVGKSENAIYSHIKSLARYPFSISPNLETSTLDAIRFAKQNHIQHIHFWSYYDKQYTIDELYQRAELCKSYELTVYFDIQTKNISDF